MFASISTYQQLLIAKTAAVSWNVVQRQTAPAMMVQKPAQISVVQKAHASLRCGKEKTDYTSRTGCNVNFVTSDVLEMLERACQPLMPPRKIPSKLTVLGAGSAVGQIVAMLLKLHEVLKILALYDDAPGTNVLGVATDVAHIDTSTTIEAYQGRSYLKAALDNSDVVLICGGTFLQPPMFNLPDRDLFFKNLQYVRSAAMAVGEFAPDAILVVQTPPLDCNLTLVKHTLKQFHAYDKRRLIGMNSTSAMRANQLVSRVVNSDPVDSFVPIIGGTGRCTRVPVFSTLKNFYCIPKDQHEFIPRLVREADDLICRVKSNGEQGHLSIGFATARCLLNIMNGIMIKPAFIDSAFVEQAHPGKCYNMKYCSTPITIGTFGQSYGITKYHVPKLNPMEQQALEDIRCDLEDMLNLGYCNAVGEEYSIHPCKLCPCCTPWEECPTCVPETPKID